MYRNCNAIKITHFFQRFSTGFDVLTTNTSPLDPVIPAVKGSFTTVKMSRVTVPIIRLRLSISAHF